MGDWTTLPVHDTSGNVVGIAKFSDLTTLCGNDYGELYRDRDGRLLYYNSGANELFYAGEEERPGCLHFMLWQPAEAYEYALNDCPNVTDDLLLLLAKLVLQSNQKNQSGPASDSPIGTDDDNLPKSQRKVSRSRTLARSAYEYASENVPNAQEMTIKELHRKLQECQQTADMLPRNADTWRKYLNDCGIRHKKSSPVERDPGKSIIRASDKESDWESGE